MDWAIKLQNYSKDDLQKLERRAEGFVANEPDTPRGKEAALLLPLIGDERERRGVKGNIAQFLEDYPDGFTDPLYRFEERNDKVVASALCKMTLSEEAFKDASGSTEVLIKAVKELVNETNLIQAASRSRSSWTPFKILPTARLFSRPCGNCSTGRASLRKGSRNSRNT